MTSCSYARSKRVCYLTTLSIFFLLQTQSPAREIGLRLPPPKTSIAPLIYSTRAPIFSIGDSLSMVPVQYPRSFLHSIAIDSTGEWITVTHTYESLDISIPRRLTLHDYLMERSRYETRNQWRDYAATHVTTKSAQDQIGRGITIETPRIKSEAFRKVFGGETLSLNVTGNITIDGNMRHEKRSQVKTAATRAPNTNFQMKQTQQFKVEGKIGENVSVFVDQDSERPFEFENAFHLRYSSDEDGIIKKIEAGNVALSLPSTRFVTFSAQNSGLFGIKSEIKIGRLDITAIASMEKGQKKKLSITGGAEEQTFQIQDYNYKERTYFFLDYFYRNQYIDNFQNGIHGYDPDFYITEIELYKSNFNYQNLPDAITGWAVLDPSDYDTTITTNENYSGYFIRMEPSEFYLNRELGFVAMDMPLQEDDVLAVAYRDSSGNVYGTLLADTTNISTAHIFKLIKPRNARPADETWYLEWKNVYSLGGRNIDREGFDLKLYYKPPSGDPEESITIDGQIRGYLNVFGLDNIDENGSPNPDNVIDIDPNIISLGRGELIFPNLRPFYPKGEDSDLPEDKWTKAIYDTLNDSYIHQQSQFYLEVKSSNRSPNYSLGMNIIEGSEQVRLNGRVLQKDRDYTIDYFSGTLTILLDEATNPDANVEIDYESQQLFSVDKKSIMGTRAEYTLWEEGTNRSFIGATFLYYNQRTLDQRVRVGKDAPMRNLVWDVNTALKFEPNFITKALDALPMLNVSGNSSIALEGEIAQVIPNPNTLNNPSTGDPDGVAYLDDFEGAKRQISLGVIRSGWGPSSPPTTSEYAFERVQSRGSLVWYNPYNQVAIRDIWPKREVTTNYGGSTRIHVLALEFWPNDSLFASWGGVQRALSSAYADQTDSRFLEVWVKGTQGRLHINLGQISEDAIPNQKLNTEDKRRGGFLNTILDEDEDTGLDGVFGDDPPITLEYGRSVVLHPHEPATIGSDGRATPYDFWDLNNNGQKEENEPWSYDQWTYTEGGEYYSNIGTINGTENNKNDGVAIYPNTEDINQNGDVDLNNDYFEFSFSLDTTSADTALIAGGKENEKGWRLYRLPLNTPSRTVGNPDWSRVEFARIWVDSVRNHATISVAEINLTGNEWKLRGVAAAGDSVYKQTDDTTMTIAVINTHDNPDEYTSPPGVEGVIDPIQKIRSKEQSLRITLTDLDIGTTAIAEKQFYQGENLINYKTLKMYVHGGDAAEDFPADSSIQFFLRWGSDTQNQHYYELRMPVFPGWDSRNNIEVSFEDLSRLKIEMETLGLDEISEVQPTGHTISVVGKPSLTNVRWLLIGVRNGGDFPFTGEVWINELRVSGVRKDKGMAMRARADIQLSDFISLNGEFNKKDADFHTVNERFGRGANTIGGNINASIRLEKLLPTSWGVSIPVTANFNKSTQTPKYLPGSDILVTKNTVPDSLLEMIQTRNKKTGFNVSFSKRTKSRNFWTRYLIDPVTGSFNYNRNDNSSSQIKYKNSSVYKGSFGYSLNFGNQYYWQPFKWLGEKGIFKKLAQTKFYYLPSRFSLTMNGNTNLNDSETRSGVVSHVITKKFIRNITTSLRPFQALSFDLTKSQSSDMRFAKWQDVLTSFNPGAPLSKTQQFSTSFNPSFFSWLTHTVKYSTNYRWSDNPQMRERGTGQSANVSTNFTISGNFDPQKFVSALRRKPSGRLPTRPRSPVTRRRPEQKSDEKEEEKEDKEDRPFPLFTLLSWIGKGIEKIDPIAISITKTQSAANYGILGDPSFAYQMGFTLDPGVTYSENVTQRSSTKEDHRFSVRSGFKITSQLTAKLDYEISSSKNQSTQTDGNVSKSTLMLKDKGIPFPNWTVQWRGLEKLPLLSKIARTVSFNHNFSGRTTETWNDSPDNITQQTITKDFRPLIGLTMNFKNGLTANVQYSTTESFTEQKKYSSGKTKRITSNLNMSANYSLKGGFKIPFLGGKKLDNNIDFSLTFTMSNNSTLQSKGASEEFAEMTRTKNWSFQPKLTYTFTRTVRGGMHLELGEREDLRMGKTKITGFGINAVISLAGT